MADGRSNPRACWFVVSLTLLSVGCTSGATKSAEQTTYTVDDTQPAQITVADAGDEPAVPPNGAAACPAGSCNYQTQVGCVAVQGGAAPSCIPQLRSDGTVAPVCVQAGVALAGESCSSWNGCEQGHVCAGGTCRKLCCGRDWTGCPARQSCTTGFSIGDQSTKVASGAYVCMPAKQCDPLTGIPCAPSTVCQIVDPIGSTACVPAPAAGTGATPGDLCPPCQTGFTCTGRGCTRLCSVDVAGPGCPLEEGHCVHWSHDPEGVGECTPVN